MNAIKSYLTAVRNAISADANNYEISFQRGNPEPCLLAENRGDFGGFAIRYRGSHNGRSAVTVQRFDTAEFGQPGWYVWDSARVPGDTDDCPDWESGSFVRFAPQTATPATVAAVLIARFFSYPD